MSLHHGLRSAAGASVADPYFANTSLLLLGNGTNGGQNNTFTDGSSNAFSVTRYGNTTQGTFSPFGYNWSNYFDGNSYAYVNDANALDLQSGDFTVEMWFYRTNSGSIQNLISNYGSTTTGYTIEIDANNKLIATLSGDAVDITGTTNVPVNQWCHVALSGTPSSSVKMFLNGVQEGSTYTGTTSLDSTHRTAIGAFWWYFDSQLYYPFPGYISNVRILKGTKLYTSNFTPPTAPLTAITNTSLLTCQSNRFLDNSSNAFSITPYGNASVTNFAPFPTNSEYSTGTNGGSGNFDGNADYLTVPANTVLRHDQGDWTLEGWFYLTSLSNSSVLLSMGNYLSADNFAAYVTTSGKVGYEAGTGSWSAAANYETPANLVPLNAWTHIAWVRSSGSLMIYVNGTRQLNQASASFGVNSTNAFYIGNYFGQNTTNATSHYSSSVRFVQGTALYTGTTLTVPTSPLTAITNTSLLLNFTNASIIDSTGKNDIETVGDAQISTATKKFGTGSLKFDGNSDWLKAPSNSVFAFGTGDFTIEFWVYVNSVAYAGTIFDTRKTNSSTAGISDYIWYSGKTYNLYINGSLVYTSSASLSLSTWYHIAVCRSGTSLRVFINGTQDGSTLTNSTNFSDDVLYVGNNVANTGAFDGNIDDFRITKGVARYTANFTPPSRQLPAR